MSSRISSVSVGPNSAVAPSTHTLNALTVVYDKLNTTHGAWSVDHINVDNYPPGLFHIHQDDKYLSVNSEGLIIMGAEQQLWDFRTGNASNKDDIFIGIRDTTKVWELQKSEGPYKGLIKMGEESATEKDAQLWQVI